MQSSKRFEVALLAEDIYPRFSEVSLSVILSNISQALLVSCVAHLDTRLENSFRRPVK